VLTDCPDGTGRDGLHAVDLRTFFFTDRYSLGEPLADAVDHRGLRHLLLVICLPIAIYLRFATGRAAALVQALAIFPLFVPSIILAYAFIRVLGPNGMVDLILNSVGLPKIRSPYLTVWGPVIGFVWDNMPLSVVILWRGSATSPTTLSRPPATSAPDGWPCSGTSSCRASGPRSSWRTSFVVLGLFSAFTFPYLLGPAAPEMMGPFMQRTFRDVNDPVQARTQAVVTFAFCAVFGWFYVRSIARNRARADSMRDAAPFRPDWIGLALAVTLSIVIIGPLLVVGLWAFAELALSLAAAQEFGLRFWDHDAVARRRLDGAHTSPATLLRRHAAVGRHLPARRLCLCPARLSRGATSCSSRSSRFTPSRVRPARRHRHDLPAAQPHRHLLGRRLIQLVAR
jgi:putative spermidine/putrescine transport system permease protein